MKRILLILLSALIMITLGCSKDISENQSSNHAEYDEKQQDDMARSRNNNPSDTTTENSVYGPSHPNYEMEVLYDSKKHEIRGSISVQFMNNLNKILNEVYFNLWPKADDFEDGDISVTNVKYNGVKANVDVDGNHLKVSGFSLPKNKRAKISMSFTVKVPEQQHRFGWDGTSVSLGNWFPILAVYDNNGWNLYPYFEEGESFYSLTGDYDVILTTDDDMVVAATGKQIERVSKRNGQATYRFKAQNVRDFAIQMNPDYRVTTEIVDGIQMNVYHTKEQDRYKEYIIDSSRQALEIFNKKIGSYAWDELHIVGMDCGFGGMEYPQLILICTNEVHDEHYIRTVVAHEIGHQWFYAAIGNNQYKEPWLDESFATFMEELGTSGLEHMIDEEFKEPKHPYRLDSPVYTFVQQGDQGMAAYSDYIYSYGLKTLDDLRIELGDDAFYKAMRQYYQEMKFKIATTSDFISIVENATGEDLSKFFEDHYIEVDK